MTIAVLARLSRALDLAAGAHAIPARLPIYLTDQVFLYEINDPTQCCVIGYHGTKATGGGGGSGKRQR